MDAYILALIRVRLAGLSSLGLLCRVTTEPDSLTDVFVAKLIEDSVTSEDDEVMNLRDLMDFDFWLCHYDVRVSASIFKFCLRITKSAAN